MTGWYFVCARAVEERRTKPARQILESIRIMGRLLWGDILNRRG
jgi:hypothetical protein